MSGIISYKILENMSEGIVKDWLSEFLPSVFAFFWSVILSILVYWIGVKLIGHFRKAVKKALEIKRAETGVMQFSDAIVQIIGYIAIILLILKLFGIQSATVAAAIASVGVAVGLALQGSFANFAGGVLILLNKPFVVGDYIREDTHGNEGTVHEISIVYTKLMQIDGRIVVIPNGILANSSMVNMTSAGKRRLDSSFSISYDDDIQKARDIIRKIMDEDDRILHDEDVLIFVRELADSAVIIGLRAWTSTEDFWKVVWDTNEKVKYAFDEAGITIPFPQLTVSKLKKH